MCVDIVFGVKLSIDLARNGNSGCADEILGCAKCQFWWKSPWTWKNMVILGCAIGLIACEKHKFTGSCLNLCSYPSTHHGAHVGVNKRQSGLFRNLSTTWHNWNHADRPGLHGPHCLLFEIGRQTHSLRQANMGNDMKKNIRYIWFSHFTWTSTSVVEFFPVVFQ